MQPAITKSNQKQKIIRSYEEYLQKFFPAMNPSEAAKPLKSPEEIGASLARETLEHVNEILSKGTQR